MCDLGQVAHLLALLMKIKQANKVGVRFVVIYTVFHFIAFFLVALGL